MTSDDTLRQLRALCLAFPGAKEKLSHGSPAFYTTKIFCWWGAHVSKTDLARGIAADALRASFSFLPDADERDALLADDRFYAPAYLGPSGWLAMDLSGATGHVDWAEVEELLDMSYRNTAGTRLIATLDARAPQR